VLVSVLPAADYPWKRGMDPAPKIIALNSWLKEYAASVGAVYLDLHSAMNDGHGGMRAELSGDGVHPNAAGYALMARLTAPAIAKALSGN
jgi:acyl-CoA thioesterase I